jgi:hypothetical protein
MASSEQGSALKENGSSFTDPTKPKYDGMQISGTMKSICRAAL